MPIKNLSRLNRASEKKSTNASAVKLLFSDIPGLDTYQLFKLPPNVMVTDVITKVSVAGQAGSSVAIGFQGEAPLATVDTAIAGSTGESGYDDTGTGKVLVITPNVALTSGAFIVIIKYVEYTLNNSEFTNYIT